MITIQDLQEAIAECLGERNPNAQTCIKLAAYYTIMEHMDPPVSYSYQAPPAPSSRVEGEGAGVVYDGDSDFAKAIQGRDSAEIWPVIDELMTTLEALQPKLYAGVMRRLVL